MKLQYFTCTTSDIYKILLFNQLVLIKKGYRSFYIIFIQIIYYYNKMAEQKDSLQNPTIISQQSSSPTPSFSLEYLKKNLQLIDVAVPSY